MAKPDPLEKLELARERAEKLRSLAKHPGWIELMNTLDQAEEMMDKQLLAQARAGTLQEREITRYEDTMRAYKLFRQNPERAVKALETALRKAQGAQPDEGDT